ncbi:MAG: DUF1289 domain-containing protein [Planctomycetota bacterium]
MPRQHHAHCPVCRQPNGRAPDQQSAEPLEQTRLPETKHLDLVTWVREHGLDPDDLCQQCTTGEVSSPCTGVCEADPKSHTCRGCRRTLAEISHWPQLSPENRAAIWLRLNNRADSEAPS